MKYQKTALPDGWGIKFQKRVFLNQATPAENAFSKPSFASGMAMFGRAAKPCTVPANRGTLDARHHSIECWRTRMVYEFIVNEVEFTFSLLELGFRLHAELRLEGLILWGKAG